jgi:uncharacterized protein YjbI with pentapeptide repeats
MKLFRSFFARSQPPQPLPTRISQPQESRTSDAFDRADHILQKYAAGDPVFDDMSLEGIDLRGRTLQKARFRGANLRNANLSNTNLRDIDFCEADLQGANLAGADLTGCNIVQADFWQANLSNTIFMPSSCSGAFLLEADFTNASIKANFDGVWIGLQTKFHSTTLAFCDFSKVQYASNLESLRKAATEKGVNPTALGRCDVDISTLNTTVKMLRADLELANKFKANPDDLLKFFQNSGLDEELVDVFFRQPLTEPQNIVSDTKYDIFVSFKNLNNRGERTPDSYMAEELHNFLTRNKLRVFMSNKASRNWEPQNSRKRLTARSMQQPSWWSSPPRPNISIHPGSVTNGTVFSMIF